MGISWSVAFTTLLCPMTNTCQEQLQRGKVYFVSWFQRHLSQSLQGKPGAGNGSRHLLFAISMAQKEGRRIRLEPGAGMV